LRDWNHREEDRVKIFRVEESEEIRGRGVTLKKGHFAIGKNGETNSPGGVGRLGGPWQMTSARGKFTNLHACTIRNTKRRSRGEKLGGLAKKKIRVDHERKKNSSLVSSWEDEGGK